jgi:GTP-binding protein Era
LEGVIKSAFVAVVGRPSVGKSTLVNVFCGEKVAIVSPVPQTTRNAIRGIVNAAAGQLVFVDTPGRHLSEKKFNKNLTKTSDRVLSESDIILYVLDASRECGLEEEAIVAALSALPVETLQTQTVVAINKIDLPKADRDATRAFIADKLPQLPTKSIFEIAALSKTNTACLLAALFDMAPEGSAYYPTDCYTDQEVAFRIAEMIRGAAISRLRDELPHAIYVNIEDMEMKNEGKTLSVRAAICVERESQKGMVVGKGGVMLGSIRTIAQREIDAIFDWKVKLDLRVKTVKDWRTDDRIIRKMR